MAVTGPSRDKLKFNSNTNYHDFSLVHRHLNAWLTLKTQKSLSRARLFTYTLNLRPIVFLGLVLVGLCYTLTAGDAGLQRILFQTRPRSFNCEGGSSSQRLSVPTFII